MVFFAPGISTCTSRCLPSSNTAGLRRATSRARIWGRVVATEWPCAATDAILVRVVEPAALAFPSALPLPLVHFLPWVSARRLRGTPLARLARPAWQRAGRLEPALVPVCAHTCRGTSAFSICGNVSLVCVHSKPRTNARQNRGEPQNPRIHSLLYGGEGD